MDPKTRCPESKLLAAASTWIKTHQKSLVIAAALLMGMLFGHFHLAAPSKALGFIRDAGLILFVYTIGIEVGPNFMTLLRRQGLSLNLLAAGIVLTGAILTVTASRLLHINMAAAVGIFAGATTNTPALGAAQEAVSHMPGLDPRLPALGYAATYPFGIIGIIIAIVITRAAMRSKLVQMPLVTERVPERPRLEDDIQITGSAAARGGHSILDSANKGLDHTNLIPMFIGISLGILLGLCPIWIAHMPVPVRLGLAGGPLIAAIVMSRIGHVGPLVWDMSARANRALRTFGITLFMACVAMKAGERLLEVLFSREGLLWMACGSGITMVPLLLAASVGRIFMGLSFGSLCGLLSGSMTDPPALAFANTMSHSDAPSTVYAAVYPFTMLWRILAAQLLVIFFAR